MNLHEMAVIRQSLVRSMTTWIVVLFLGLGFAPSFATPSAPTPKNRFDEAIVAERAKVIVKQLKEQYGIEPARSIELLSQAAYLPKVVDAVRPPKSPTVKNWDTYRSRFVEPYRIKKGVEFWSTHREALQEASTKYQVPIEVIVSIIGVETIYGQHIGNYRVLDSLATLSFAYPSGQKDRSEFFMSELVAFIALCETTHLDALEVKGSYAGAIGLGQFMPSSWAKFAVDGDNDGTIDLFHSVKDAIHSVANFLKVHGWQAGKAGRIEVEIENTESLPELLAPDILPTFTASTLQSKGLKLKGEAQPEELLALVELVRGANPSTYVVGGQNFYVVTRYNRSAFYANSVLELAAELVKAMRP